MKLHGTYAKQTRLEEWWSQSEIDVGQIPAIRTEISLELLNRAPAVVTMWALADTGAPDILIPGQLLGVEDAGDGSLALTKGGIAKNAMLQECTISGVGGASPGFQLKARISIDGVEFPEPFMIRTGPHVRIAIVGRNVLNSFVGVLCPKVCKFVLSDSSIARTIEWCFKSFA